MGFFKKITKTFKKSVNTIGGAVIGGAIGFATGGPIGAVIGAAGGAIGGYGQDRSMRAQEKAQDAQIAAAQRIANAQNPANLVTAVTPTAGVENVAISEENMANDARRRYSFSKTLYNRRNRLGSSGGNNQARTTLG